jgi:hypothetical protein
MRDNNNDDELYHYGVLGMKWGQHLFAKAKNYITSTKTYKRYLADKKVKQATKDKIRKLAQQAKIEAHNKKLKANEEAKLNKAKELLYKKYGIDYRKKDTASKDPKSTKFRTKNNPLSVKEIKSLSDKELFDRNSRLQQEKQLKELQQYHEAGTRKILREVGNNVIKKASINAGEQVLESFLRDNGNKIVGAYSKQFGEAIENYKKKNGLN